MKKILQIAIIALFSFNNAQAQLPNGSTGPDFTANDINGNSISLYTDFLDQGIPVIMDISATWCPPCWSLHQAHTLKDIYMNYGNGGSGEIGVLFIEGDGSTGLAELQGISGSTMGDWVTGTPYPIIDNAGIANSYQLPYYPIIYGICPDRTVYEIGNSASSASYFMQQLISNCSSVTVFNGVIDNVAIDEGSEKVCSGKDVTPSFKVHNFGTNQITSFTAELFEIGNPTAIDVNNWTGNLAVNSDVTIQFNVLTSVFSAANYEVIVSNPNGNVDNYPTMNDADYAIQIAPITAENTVVFEITTDNYPEETSWIIKDGAGTTLASGGTYTGQPNTTFTETVTLANDDCYEITVNDTYGDGLLSGGYSLTDATTTLITASAPGFGYSVVEPFSSESAVSASWDCDGQGNCSDPGTGNGQYTSLTNCQTNCMATEISEEISTLSVYPNPVKDVLTISGIYSSVEIYDIYGKLVLSAESAKTINVSALSSGFYMLNINTEKETTTQKITITK